MKIVNVVMKRVEKIFICGIMAVIMPMALTACSNKKDESNQFKVGLECAYAPFNWTQTDDSNGGVPLDTGFAGGYDVEIAKRIAKGLGKELVIVKTEWGGLLPSVTSGKIDAIIAGMSATESRKESIDFSDNYYTSDLVVVVLKDGPFANAKGLNDFAGAKITAQLDTFHYDVIDQMTGVEKQTAMEDFPTMIVSLSAGKVDGYISERPGALSAAASNPNITFIALEPNFKYSIDESSIAVGLKKGSPLTPEINKILATISDEERAQIMSDAVLNQPSAE